MFDAVSETVTSSLVVVLRSTGTVGGALRATRRMKGAPLETIGASVECLVQTNAELGGDPA